MPTPTISDMNARTHVVELTPPGRAAVAVVLVAGPDALNLVGRCFQSNSGRPISETPINRIVVGLWGGAEGEELVVCRRADEKIEIHCHGGYAAVAAVVDDLVSAGGITMLWREWLQLRSQDATK